MSDYQPIDCSDYDFLEIACMDGYDIEVKLDSGTLRGHARGLEIRSGEEFLRIRTSSDGIEDIRVDRIREIHVLSTHARFRKHIFATP
tara:strand:- start:472 stop:735 length:264 start_codon:yes stop_codon:yes gene_type:complete